MSQRIRTVSPLRAGDPPKLGNHTLLGRLGAGGMGVVYLAEGPSGLVAIKVVRDELSQDPDFRTRFQREVRACFLVSGPWTARLVDFDVTANPPWLATEFLDAPDLQEVVDSDGPFSGAAQVRLALDLARGLASLHSHTLVHRDLKPSNILIPPDGPKIIDFGIASAVEDIGSLTATANVVGSPAWMSPEQILDGVSGMASDVYSWGAVVAFSATGQPLVAGRNIHQIMSNALSLDVSSAVAKVDAALRPVVAAALQTDPDLRPTAAEIAATLAPLQGDLGQESAGSDSTAGTTRRVEVWSPPPDRPGEPQPVPTQRLATSQWQKHKTAWTVAGAACVLLAGGITALLLSGSTPTGHKGQLAAGVSPSVSAATSSRPAGSLDSAPNTSSGPSAASSTTPAALAVPFRPVLNDSALVSRVPSSLRPTCTVQPKNPPSTSQVSCRFDAPDGTSNLVNYSGYKTAADMRANVSDGDKVANGCRDGLSKFMALKRDGRYQNAYTDGRHYGIVNCQFVYNGPTNSYSNIVWTDDSLSLEGFISDDNGTEAAYQELYRQWLQVRHAA